MTDQLFISIGPTYILDQDTYTAMEFYLKAINEPKITEPLRNAAINTCEQLKMALIS